MFANHSDLITQIHAIIQKNPIENQDLQIDLAEIERSLEITRETGRRNYYPFLDKKDARRLEERLDNLEEQNGKLQCIIQFLLVQLAQLRKEVSNAPLNGAEKLNGHGDPARNGKREGAKAKKPLLTKRETEVFDLLAKGMCAKEIAKSLFISETTVITHKKNLKEKFHARNTVEMISNILGH